MPPDTSPGLGHHDAAGWALGALDPADAQAFEIHLRDCGECQQTVTEFEAVARALKSPAPAVEPPADLQAKTLASVQHAILASKRGEQAKTVQYNTIAMAIPAQKPPAVAGTAHTGPASPAAGQNPEREPAKMARWWHWHWNFPVFSLAAACGAAAFAIVLVVAQQAGQLASSPVAAQFSLSAVSGPGSAQVVAHRGGNGWTLDAAVRHLPPLTGNQYYECWYIGPHNSPAHPDAISAGTFKPGPSGSGTFPMISAANPHRYKIMEITIQHPGDSGRPGTVVLRGTAQEA